MDPVRATTRAAGQPTYLDSRRESLYRHAWDEGLCVPNEPSALRQMCATSRPALDPASWPGQHRIPEATGHYGHHEGYVSQGPVQSLFDGQRHGTHVGYAAAGYQARQRPPPPSFGTGGSPAVATSYHGQERRAAPQGTYGRPSLSSVIQDGRRVVAVVTPAEYMPICSTPRGAHPNRDWSRAMQEREEKVRAGELQLQHACEQDAYERQQADLGREDLAQKLQRWRHVLKGKCTVSGTAAPAQSKAVRLVECDHAGGSTPSRACMHGGVANPGPHWRTRRRRRCSRRVGRLAHG
ncbi:hypothetical protein SDRG_12173 [Saprolegnia diclina VS20]|uniref:Uncharacterized protein n=1 Tax=Saprolegnia diclina (strain VS20) TaxID=1156394 RepID=T0RD05_SAPDV|nr:hypothetical protein SDRG_12173 [Saprolegnia diclina VS20]EQC30113.1 hypothetical protein SDRG_12173 [Saprolegnia diclina VS20]|eukprot:XP_008616456.1 hypothetical protein SDRG_12173 [Saprolegnia diclina VS20]